MQPPQSSEPTQLRPARGAEVRAAAAWRRMAELLHHRRKPERHHRVSRNGIIDTFQHASANRYHALPFRPLLCLRRSLLIRFFRCRLPDGEAHTPFLTGYCRHNSPGAGRRFRLKADLREHSDDGIKVHRDGCGADRLLPPEPETASQFLDMLPPVMKQVRGSSDIHRRLHKPDGKRAEPLFRKSELSAYFLQPGDARKSGRILRKAVNLKVHAGDDIPQVVDVPVDHGAGLGRGQVRFGHTVAEAVSAARLVRPGSFFNKEGSQSPDSGDFVSLLPNLRLEVRKAKIAAQFHERDFDVNVDAVGQRTAGVCPSDGPAKRLLQRDPHNERRGGGLRGDEVDGLDRLVRVRVFPDEMG